MRKRAVKGDPSPDVPRLSRRRLLSGGVTGLALSVLGGKAGAQQRSPSIWGPPPSAGAGAAQFGYQLATDEATSPYYAVGEGLATLVKMRATPESGLDLNARTSLGSWHNALLLSDGKAQFAIMQALFGVWSSQGTGVFRDRGPDRHLRAIAALWSDVEHYLLKSTLVAGGTVADIRNLHGAPFAFGQRGSSAEASGHYLMYRLGIDPDRAATSLDLSPSEAASAMMMSKAVGMNLPGAPPIPVIDMIFSQNPSIVSVLEFTDRELRMIDGGMGLWTRQIIPAGTYSGLEHPIQSIGQTAFLAVSDTVPAEHVYMITRMMFENLPLLRSSHRAAANVSAETAVAGLPVPLHPGAARYYAEQGIAIPATPTPPA